MGIRDSAAGICLGTVIKCSFGGIKKEIYVSHNEPNPPETTDKTHKRVLCWFGTAYCGGQLFWHFLNVVQVNQGKNNQRNTGNRQPHAKLCGKKFRKIQRGGCHGGRTQESARRREVGIQPPKTSKTTRTLAQIKYSWMGGSIFPCCTYRCHFLVAITNVFSNTVAIGDKRGGKGEGSNPGAHVPKSQEAGEILNVGEGHFLAKAIFLDRHVSKKGVAKGKKRTQNNNMVQFRRYLETNGT